MITIQINIMCKKCKDFEERLQEIEKVVSPNSLTLVNKQDPNESVVLKYDGEFTSKKLTASVAVEELGTTIGL